ncbi:hypothetical protein ACFQJ7_17040 [Halovenus rubra]|uniref:Uncharacterized protein n=2 Tax=Halovenus rubra TaxID=869890 RepID=A0ACC7DVP8_9EURY
MRPANLSSDTIERLEDSREDLEVIAESDLRCSKYAESLLEALE